jgi:integrase
VLQRETAKTPTGERTLPLDKGTDRPGSHGGYVAADEIGAGYSTQRLRGTFYRLVESGGLRRITFYHARHFALSYLLNSGQVPIAVVAAWAGDSGSPIRGASRRVVHTRHH